MKNVSAFFLVMILLVSNSFAFESLTPPTVESECLKFTKNLSPSDTTKMMSSNDDVILLQKFLLAQGYFQGASTGVYGKNTTLAVKAYQKKEGILQTGIVGPKTRDSIVKKSCVKSIQKLSTEKATTSVKLEGTSSKMDSVSSTFIWYFHTKKYQMEIPLSHSLYMSYKESPKVYSYSGKLPPNWTEQYNAMFLTIKPDDYTFDSVTNALVTLSRKEGFSNVETANFVLSFVQAIPYDFSKDIQKDHTQYPYETLFTKKGVCADKTFLAYHLFKRMGYGVAILQYLEKNHQALGIKCPQNDSVSDSAYCYAETTNYLPIGVIPTSFGVKGESSLTINSQNLPLLLDGSRLGNVDVLVKSDGKTYEGVADIKQKIEKMTRLGKEIEETQAFIASTTVELNSDKIILETIRQAVDIAVTNKDYTVYKEKLPEFDTKFALYKVKYKTYEDSLSLYKKDVKEYNELLIILDQNKSE